MDARRASVSSVESGTSADEATHELSMRMAATRSVRRTAVSAEVTQGIEGWVPPVYPKTPEERTQLLEIIKNSSDSKLKIMFGNLQPDIVQKVIDAMFAKDVAEGEHVIEEGDEGDYFYIVKRGHFDLFKADAQGDNQKVFEGGQGFSFGELGLLYNALRSATVVATEPSEVWCLERMPFRMLVVRSDEERFNRYMDFLRRCEIFAELSDTQIAKLAEAFREEDFEADEAILEQGERDDNMYILIKGEAVACIMGERGEVEVAEYKPGDYFGEIALLLGEPRKASVYALGPVTCLCISRETFNSLLGPLREFLQRNIDKYEKYQEALQKGRERRNSREERRASDDLTASTDAGRLRAKTEDWSGAVAMEQRARRLRDRTKIVQEELTPEPLPMPPAGSFDERLRADFNNPALSQPDPALAVATATIQVFGGWRLGEAFADDKEAIVRTPLLPSSAKVDEELKWGDRSFQHHRTEDTWTWTSPTWLRGCTHAFVQCQKNLKEKSTVQTPNQDNYFVVHVDGLQLYGVCDGHGPFGHLVSFRLVQSLPYFITVSEHYRKDWSLTLKEAFAAAQEDLLKLAQDHDINLDSSGASGTVLVFEGPRIHVAHVGDSSCMVASWNRKDSRLVYGTRDHKPLLPGEKERLEAAGMEVRQEDDRIYLPGQNFPGLTMSRCFGDTSCKGLIQEPEYREILCQPDDQYYAVLASDGIWEFINYDEALAAVGDRGGLDISKKLRMRGPAGAAGFFSSASRKRWQYVDSSYCDDVTCLVVQWNVPAEGTPHNQQLTVKRPG